MPKGTSDVCSTTWLAVKFMLSSISLSLKIAAICTQCQLSITTPFFPDTFGGPSFRLSVHPMAIFPTSWAPSFILGFSCIVIVVISALGTGIYLLHVRHIQPRIRARKAARLRGFSASTAVDKEKTLEHGPLPYSNVPVNSSAVWPAPTPHQPDSGLQPPDPQLPWPVLAVLPSLRPKDPVHVRMKNAVMLRNKQEVRVRLFSYCRPLYSHSYGCSTSRSPSPTS